MKSKKSLLVILAILISLSFNCNAFAQEDSTTTNTTNTDILDSAIDADKSNSNSIVDDALNKLETKGREFTLNDNTTLKIDIPKSWQIKTDSDGNVIFQNIYSKQPLLLTLFFNIFKYDSDEEMKKFILLHKKQAISTIPNKGKIKEGFDHVLGLQIPYIMILEEKDDSDKTVHKILYPYNTTTVFPMVSSIKGDSEIKDLELLLNTIVLSILKQKYPATPANNTPVE